MKKSLAKVLTVSNKKENLEFLIIIFFLILSLFHYLLLVIFFVYLLTLLKQKEIGAIKVINIITLRSIINPGIGVGIDTVQYLKWAILIFCACYLLLSFLKIKKIEREKISLASFFIVIYGMYSIISSFIFSSLPVVAAFKVITYTLVFLGVMYGVIYTSLKVNWLKWFTKLVGIGIIPSIFLITQPVGYLRNGQGFQGLINHPNLFGIVTAMFIALLLGLIQRKETNYTGTILLVISFITSFYLIILTQSRTAFITCLVLSVMYVIFSKMKKIIKYLMFLLAFSVIVIVPSSKEYLYNFTLDFLYKGNSNLMYSREGQLEGLLSNFLSNPFFGTGFQVPVLDFKTYNFSFGYVVEPGNIFLAVLSYGGILGFVLFACYLIFILLGNIKHFKEVGFLFITPLIISMGEMVFFSTNNIGIWCYMFLAIYFTSDYSYMNKSKMEISS